MIFPIIHSAQTLKMYFAFDLLLIFLNDNALLEKTLFLQR